MNAKNLIIAASLFTAAGAAMADGLSRADVRGELERAYAAGNYVRPVVAEAADQGVPVSTAAVAARKEAAPAAPVAKAEAGKTRAEVRAELEREYLAGNYTRPTVLEAIEYPQTASTRTRDEVRAEAIQAAKGKQFKDTNLGS